MPQNQISVFPALITEPVFKRDDTAEQNTNAVSLTYRQPTWAAFSCPGGSAFWRVAAAWPENPRAESATRTAERLWQLKGQLD